MFLTIALALMGLIVWGVVTATTRHGQFEIYTEGRTIRAVEIRNYSNTSVGYTLADGTKGTVRGTFEVREITGREANQP